MVGLAGVAAWTVVGVEAMATHKAMGPAAITVQTATRERRTRRCIA
ncbi:hypothetical protein A6P39_001880 [Streptomyces sp. FXJ1.172]|nr:hypothetical protein [Streptomyces sp. FXJ1.172]WEP00493.1 hypothetical protein A6P39_001880 [Streptomyces sp. FXJ1.172]